MVYIFFFFFFLLYVPFLFCENKVLAAVEAKACNSVLYCTNAAHTTFFNAQFLKIPSPILRAQFWPGQTHLL